MVLVEPATAALGRAFVDACEQVGAVGFIIVVSVQTSGAEPPEPVALAMKECDAVIMATQKSLSHTKARRQANRGGTRIVSIPGITEEMMASGCLTANHQDVEKAMASAFKVLRKADALRVTTTQGTDLALEVKGRDWITDDTGLCRNQGSFSTFPAGELLVAPLEGTADGTLAVDVLFHQFLKTPAEATVREGYAVRVTGAAEAEKAMDAGGHEGRHLSRLGIGFNPQASLSSTPLEATKALGVLHIGFGDNTVLGGEVNCGVFVEAVLKWVNVEADGKLVLERGRSS